jgi:hypothetical protein
MRGGEREKTGLTSFDVLAQAAMILRAEREAVSDLEHAYLMAKFFENRDLMYYVRGVVCPLLGGGENSARAAEKIALMYLGMPIGERALRNDLCCSDKRMRELKFSGYRALDQVHHAAIQKCSQAFGDKGWLVRL